MYTWLSLAMLGLLLLMLINGLLVPRHVVQEYQRDLHVAKVNLEHARHILEEVKTPPPPPAPLPYDEDLAEIGLLQPRMTESGELQWFINPDVI